VIKNISSGRQESTVKFLKQHLDIKNKNGLEWQALCPYHEDSSPSFSVNIRKGLFICYACGAKGNMKQLAEHLNAIAPAVEPSATLEDVIGTLTLLQDASREASKFRPSVGLPYPSKYSLQTNITSAIDYFCFKRDLHYGAIEAHRLAYDTIEEDAVIPLSDLYGNIVGFINRTNCPIKLSEGAPKYRYPKGLAISRHLFGADVALKEFTANFNRGKQSVLVITEGSIDAMSIFGIRENVCGVAVLGARISSHQCEVIKKIAPEKIIIATDRDIAGRKAEMQIQYELKQLKMGCEISCLSWDKKLGKDLAELNQFDRTNIVLREVDSNK
jgi:DNA primase